MRNLRFALEDVNDRSRAVEPNRLSPTGGGFTGLEAMLQYFFVQSQAINIYDSKGFLLKLSVLLNECSQYTNAASAIAHPARTARCKQWLGPNQTGINAGAVARMTPHKPTGPSPQGSRQDPRRAGAHPAGARRAGTGAAGARRAATGPATTPRRRRCCPTPRTCSTSSCRRSAACCPSAAPARRRRATPASAASSTTCSGHDGAPSRDHGGHGREGPLRAMRGRRQPSVASKPVFIGAVTTLVVIAAVLLAYQANQGLPFVPTFELKVDTPDAARLVVGNEVREGGFRVGQVAKIEPGARDGFAARSSR